jgi:hypothetical protein
MQQFENLFKPQTRPEQYKDRNFYKDNKIRPELSKYVKQFRKNKEHENNERVSEWLLTIYLSEEKANPNCASQLLEEYNLHIDKDYFVPISRNCGLYCVKVKSNCYCINGLSGQDFVHSISINQSISLF